MVTDVNAEQLLIFQKRVKKHFVAGAQSVCPSGTGGPIAPVLRRAPHRRRPCAQPPAVPTATIATYVRKPASDVWIYASSTRANAVRVATHNFIYFMMIKCCWFKYEILFEAQCRLGWDNIINSSVDLISLRATGFLIFNIE